MKLTPVDSQRVELGAEQRNADRLTDTLQGWYRALTALVSADVWVSLKLSPRWSSVGGVRVAKRINRVFLRGSATNVTAGTSVAVVPLDCRPNFTLSLPGVVFEAGVASNVPACFSVSKTGEITVDYPPFATGSVAYFDGLSYEVG